MVSKSVIVLFITSSGLKDIGSTANTLPEVPFIEPNMSTFAKTLKTVYGFSLE